MHVEVGGLTIAFERAGTGPVLVLAHGFVGDARSTWGSQIEALSDEFTVIAWDAPGAGGSTTHRKTSAWTPTLTAWPGSSGHCASSERTWRALLRRGFGARSVSSAPRARVLAHPRERVRRLARLARQGRGRSEAGTIAEGIPAHARGVRRRDGTVDVLAVGRVRTRGSVPRQRAGVPSEWLSGDVTRQLRRPASRVG